MGLYTQERQNEVFYLSSLALSTVVPPCIYLQTDNMIEQLVYTVLVVLKYHKKNANMHTEALTIVSDALKWLEVFEAVDVALIQFR